MAIEFTPDELRVLGSLQKESTEFKKASGETYTRHTIKKVEPESLAKIGLGLFKPDSFWKKQLESKGFRHDVAVRYLNQRVFRVIKKANLDFVATRLGITDSRELKRLQKEGLISDKQLILRMGDESTASILQTHSAYKLIKAAKDPKHWIHDRLSSNYLSAIRHSKLADAKARFPNLVEHFHAIETIRETVGDNVFKMLLAQNAQIELPAKTQQLLENLQKTVRILERLPEAKQGSETDMIRRVSNARTIASQLDTLIEIWPHGSDIISTFLPKRLDATEARQLLGDLRALAPKMEQELKAPRADAFRTFAKSQKEPIKDVQSFDNLRRNFNLAQVEDLNNQLTHDYGEDVALKVMSKITGTEGIGNGESHYSTVPGLQNLDSHLQEIGMIREATRDPQFKAIREQAEKILDSPDALKQLDANMENLRLKYREAAWKTSLDTVKAKYGEALREYIVDSFDENFTQLASPDDDETFKEMQRSLKRHLDPQLEHAEIYSLQTDMRQSLDRFFGRAHGKSVTFTIKSAEKNVSSVLRSLEAIKDEFKELTQDEFNSVLKNFSTPEKPLLIYLADVQKEISRELTKVLNEKSISELTKQEGPIFGQLLKNYLTTNAPSVVSGDARYSKCEFSKWGPKEQRLALLPLLPQLKHLSADEIENLVTSPFALRSPFQKRVDLVNKLDGWIDKLAAVRSTPKKSAPTNPEMAKAFVMALAEPYIDNQEVRKGKKPYTSKKIEGLFDYACKLSDRRIYSPDVIAKGIRGAIDETRPKLNKSAFSVFFEKFNGKTTSTKAKEGIYRHAFTADMHKQLESSKVPYTPEAYQLTELIMGEMKNAGQKMKKADSETARYALNLVSASIEQMTTGKKSAVELFSTLRGDGRVQWDLSKVTEKNLGSIPNIMTTLSTSAQKAETLTFADVLSTFKANLGTGLMHFTKAFLGSQVEEGGKKQLKNLDKPLDILAKAIDTSSYGSLDKIIDTLQGPQEAQQTKLLLAFMQVGLKLVPVTNAGTAEMAQLVSALTVTPEGTSAESLLGKLLLPGLLSQVQAARLYRTYGEAEEQAGAFNNSKKLAGWTAQEVILFGQSKSKGTLTGVDQKDQLRAMELLASVDISPSYKFGTDKATDKQVLLSMKLYQKKVPATYQPVASETTLRLVDGLPKLKKVLESSGTGLVLSAAKTFPGLTQEVVKKALQLDTLPAEQRDIILGAIPAALGIIDLLGITKKENRPHMEKITNLMNVVLTATDPSHEFDEEAFQTHFMNTLSAALRDWLTPGGSLLAALREVATQKK